MGARAPLPQMAADAVSHSFAPSASIRHRRCVSAAIRRRTHEPSQRFRRYRAVPPWLPDPDLSFATARAVCGESQVRRATSGRAGTCARCPGAGSGTRRRAHARASIPGHRERAFCWLVPRCALRAQIERGKVRRARRCAGEAVDGALRGEAEVAALLSASDASGVEGDPPCRQRVGRRAAPTARRSTRCEAVAFRVFRRGHDGGGFVAPCRDVNRVGRVGSVLVAAGTVRCAAKRRSTNKLLIFTCLNRSEVAPHRILLWIRFPADFRSPRVLAPVRSHELSGDWPAVPSPKPSHSAGPKRPAAA